MNKHHLALLALLTGCTEITSLRDYDFRDTDGGRDAGVLPDTDAGFDGGFDACVPTELCNGLDDDCDGATDEDFDLTSDEANCGGCGNVCDGVFCAASECVRATKVEAGGRHTCALLSNGEVWCWGRNTDGELGDGTVDDRSVPTRVANLSPVRDIAVGEAHTCAVTMGQELYCWGGNANGQLGVGSTEPQSMPVQVSLTFVTEVVAGRTHTCAVHDLAELRCWGANSAGELGLGDTMQRESPPATATLMGIRNIWATSNHTCALTSTFQCWGVNAYGKLGDGTTMFRTTPVPVNAGGSVASVSMSLVHTCAALSDGTARCWGHNGLGQLGDGTMVDSLVPVTVVDLASVDAISAAASNILEVSSSCAISDGQVFCWGSGGSGQLGTGVTPLSRSARPVLIEGVTATSLAGGHHYFCALTPEGTVNCWGGNDRGQLGRGTESTGELPGFVQW